MELVGAGLGDEADLCSGGSSGVGVGEAGGDAKLLDRILGLAKDASEGEAVDLVVVVDTVHGDVALIGPAAIDSATPAVLHGGIAGWRQINDARLEGEDVRHVAGLAGERLNGRVVRRVSQRGVGDVQRLRCRGDVDDLTRRLQTEHEVDGGWLVYQ
jgi:hypothetical protein